MVSEAKQLFSNSYLHIYIAAAIHGSQWWLDRNGFNWWNRRETYTFDVIYYIKDGSFDLKLNDRWHTLTKNQMAYIPAGTRLEYRIASDGHLEKYYTHFDLLFGRNTLDACFQFPRIIHVADTARADALFEALVTRNDPFGIGERGALLQLIAFFLEESGAVLQQQTLMRKAAQYIADHCHENISVTRLAEHCGYSKDHFTRKFKETYGCTPRQYISAAKLNHAKQLLLTTDMSIWEVADALGFRDAGHFTNFFSSKTQLSPSFFRKNSRASKDS